MSSIELITPTILNTRSNELLIPPGRLPRLFSESRTDRNLWSVFAAIIITGFSLMLHSYWVPSTAGPDENGYLVGGKYFAATGSTGFKPANPYSFVGGEWIEAKGKYFPKYPLGLSVIFAAVLKLGGAKFGVPLCFMVNPVAMSAALLATYLLARLVVGSLYGMLAMLLVASSPVCIGLTNTPNSHATAICCVSWGFYLLVRWWQSNGIYRAIGAGLLIGFAVTVRYTEGMLILPIAVVAILNWQKQSRQYFIEAASLIFSWSVPIMILAAYNWFSMHHLTGYDPTNESTGFSWETFQLDWEIMLRELYNTGLFFTLPFTLFGSVLMFRWNWKISLLLASWAVPNLLLYTSYYWAPDSAGISYMRFVLTIFPALAIFSAWGFKWIAKLAADDGAAALPTVCIGLMIAIGAGVSLVTALNKSNLDAQSNRTLLEGAQTVQKLVPAGSLIFSDRAPLNYYQLVSDYQLCDLSQFDPKWVQSQGNVNPDIATAGLQVQRALEIYDRVKGLNDSQMATELRRQQNQLMTDAISLGQHVYFVLPTTRRGEINRLLPRNLFSTSVLASWDEPLRIELLKKPHWAGVGPANNMADARVSPTWQLIEVKLAPPPPVKAKAVRAKPTPAMKK